MGSDQMAAEALQEAETEVVVAVKGDRNQWTVRVAGQCDRSAVPAIDVGLTA